MQSLFARILCCLILALIPAGRVTAISFAGRMPDLFYVDLPLFLFFLCSGFSLTLIPNLIRNGWIPLGAFFVVAMLGVFVSADKLSYMGSLRPLGWAILSVALTGYLRNSRDVILVLQTSVLAVAVVSLEIFSISGFDGLTEATKQDVELEWGRSNYFASFALVSIFISFGLVLHARGFLSRAIGIIGILGAVLILYQSKSRAAFLAVLIVASTITPLLNALSSANQARLNRAILYVCMVLPMIGLSIFLYPLMLDSIGYSAEEFMDSGNFRRLDAWSSAINQFATNPLTGIGWFNMTVMNEQLTDTGTTSHSLPLQTLAETGLIGFLALASTFWLSLGGRGRTPHFSLPVGLRNFIRCGIFASLVHCCVEPSFWGVQFVTLFWIMLGILFYSQAEKTSKPIENKEFEAEQAIADLQKRESPIAIQLKKSRALK